MTEEEDEFEDEIHAISECFYFDGGLRSEEELKTVLKDYRAQILKENPLAGLTDEMIEGILEFHDASPPQTATKKWIMGMGVLAIEITHRREKEE